MTNIKLDVLPLTDTFNKQASLPLWPRVSIITVVFNGDALLDKTITAVRELSYPNVEYIIVDGGSKDLTVKIIKSHSDGIARWISEPDRGIYDAMNKGLNLATGDFVWFLNAGDTPAKPDVLNCIFVNETDFDYYYGDSCLINESGQIIKTVNAPSILLPSSMLYGMQVSHQSILVKRKIAPLYCLKYNFIADQKWIVDILRTTTNGRYINIPISNYLLGGLSHQRYGRFVQEKMRYSFDELSFLHASFISFLDVLKAVKFYFSIFLRRSGVL